MFGPPPIGVTHTCFERPSHRPLGAGFEVISSNISPLWPSPCAGPPPHAVQTYVRPFSQRAVATTSELDLGPRQLRVGDSVHSVDNAVEAGRTLPSPDAVYSTCSTTRRPRARGGGGT